MQGYELARRGDALTCMARDWQSTEKLRKGMARERNGEAELWTATERSSQEKH